MATTTMRFVKTPTSSLSATELLGHQIWYRSKAIFNKLRRRGASKISAPRSSPIARLPQELVEIIISYFIHDTKTLLACSTTCYAWYIAVVPHLHYNLTTDNWLLLAREERYRWPTPLQRSYKLGLLPLVKRFRIRLNYSPFSKFSPDWLNKRNLRYFTALTNLQELGIDDLQLSDFMPNIQQIFGHFAPTLRFLALRQPEGTCREILYFIGLFPNLQDLKLCYSLPLKEEDGEDNPALVPLSTPPLRGRLTLTCFTRDSLVRGMITSFGGLRFRSMDLFRVTCAQLLLDSCAETLETIRLYPTDPCGPSTEGVLRNFNLSRNTSLRTLEITAASINAAGTAAVNFFQTVLSTITSPGLLDVVIIYKEYDVDYVVRYCENPVYVAHGSAWQRAINILQHCRQFLVFGEMHRIREFRLLLCADVLECITESAVERLKRIVEVERKCGGLYYLPREPLIIAERRAPRTDPRDDSVGLTSTWYISASAL